MEDEIQAGLPDRKVLLIHKWAGGIKRYYAGNENAQLFAELTGWKTVPGDKIELIRKLGFTVEIEEQGRSRAA